ncbi:MAG: hypothetical protein ISS76_21055, partial [Phycisphaerae bacterium]|nr:hypothetical protein [Phycisphaerae bacterium]
QISDISALAGLTNLSRLDLRVNPLNQDAYNIYIPRILQNNPVIRLYWDTSAEDIGIVGINRWWAYTDRAISPKLDIIISEEANYSLQVVIHATGLTVNNWKLSSNPFIVIDGDNTHYSFNYIDEADLGILTVGRHELDIYTLVAPSEPIINRVTFILRRKDVPPPLDEIDEYDVMFIADWFVMI